MTGAERHQVYISASTRRRPCWWSRDRPGRARRPPVAVIVPADCRRLGQAPAPVDLLLPSASSPCTSTGCGPARARWSARSEGSARFSTALIPNGLPEPPSPSRRAVTLWAPRPGTPPTAKSGPSRSAPTRASRTRWPGPRSRRARALMTRQPPGSTTTACPRGSRQHGQVQPPPRPPLRPSTRPSRPRRERPGQSEVRAHAVLGLARLLRIAAGQPGDDPELRGPARLGLPRSY